MAIDLGFGFGKSKSKTSGISETEKTETGKKDVITTGTEKGTETQTIDTSVKTLDDATIQALQDALETFGASGQEFLSALEARALEGDSTLAAENARIVEAERQRLDQKVQSQQAQFGGAAGSNFNTLALAATTAEQGRAGAELAGIQGQLNLAARQQISNEFAQVIEGGQGVGNTIAQIAGVLKGAITDTTGSVTTETDKQIQSTEMTDLLNELFSRTKYSESTKGSKSGFNLSFT